MTNGTTYVTSQGYDELTKELENLKKVRRPEISERIKEAKELGDLSENAEYADARDEQSFTEGRILEIESMMKNVEVIQKNGDNDPDVVEIGDTIIVEKDEIEKQYTIVGSNEANPLNGIISNESPIGQSCIGKRKGEDAIVDTPKGKATYKIVSIKR